MSQPELVFLAAKRTPFGALGGALAHLSATDLAVHASLAALAQSGVAPDAVEQVLFGNVVQTSRDAIYLARHVGLRCGLPEAAPAVTLNRLCGSGFEAIAAGAKELLLGEAEVVLVGGTESMSQAPHVLRGGRKGFAFGKAPELEDSLWSALTDTYTGLPMGLTAENLAVAYGISREACDDYALRSQQAWASAQAAGRFAAELAPVALESRKGPSLFDRDEHPRPETTRETLARLKPVFKTDGTVTAGNASGISDGAVALVLSTRAFAEARGLKPLGRLVGFTAVGCDPKVMGIGPVPATQKLLARTGLSLAQCELIEVNEAFAPQYLAVEAALSLPRDRTNVDGGAIAIGHPLAASGARLTAHLLTALAARGGGRGLASACIGGGQGMSVLVEV